MKLRGYTLEAECIDKAARQMRFRHAELGRYPEVWEDVILKGDTCMGERGYAPHLWPDPQQGPRWELTVSDEPYTYVIAAADSSSFRIDGIDSRGRRTLTMSEKDELPVELLPQYCEYESHMTKEERPLMFLRDARHALWRSGHPLPEVWEDVWAMHWSEQEHFMKDPSAKPPPGTGRVWTPPGSDYSYELNRQGDEGYQIRSYNDKGLQNYMIVEQVYDPFLVDP